MTPEQLSADGSEHGHQSAFFCAVALKHRWLNHLIFAIPNGGERNKIVASRLKAEGVKRGIPDIFCAVPRGIYAGLFIEMKKPSERGRASGGLSPDQQDVHCDLRNQHYMIHVAYDWAEAFMCLERYLAL